MTKKALTPEQKFACNLIFGFFSTLFVVLIATLVLLIETIEVPSKNSNSDIEKVNS